MASELDDARAALRMRNYTKVAPVDMTAADVKERKKSSKSPSRIKGGDIAPSQRSVAAGKQPRDKKSGRFAAKPTRVTAVKSTFAATVESPTVVAELRGIHEEIVKLVAATSLGIDQAKDQSVRAREDAARAAEQASTAPTRVDVDEDPKLKKSQLETLAGGVLNMIGFLKKALFTAVVKFILPIGVALLGAWTMFKNIDFGPILKPLKRYFNFLLDAVIDVGKFIWDVLVVAFKAWMAIGTKLWDGLKIFGAWLEEKLQPIFEWMGVKLGEFSDWLGVLWEETLQPFLGVLSDGLGKVGDFFDWFKDASPSDVMTFLIDIFKQIPTMFLKALKKVPGMGFLLGDDDEEKGASGAGGSMWNPMNYFGGDDKDAEEKEALNELADAFTNVDDRRVGFMDRIRAHAQRMGDQGEDTSQLLADFRASARASTGRDVLENEAHGGRGRGSRGSRGRGRTPTPTAPAAPQSLGSGSPTAAHQDMKVSPQGVARIAEYEGFKPEAYEDGGGVWTIGHGLTEWDGKKVSATHPGGSVTEQESYAQKLKMLDRFEKGINEGGENNVRLKVGVTQEQFDALASVAYNKGNANDLIRKLNAGEELTYEDFAASASIGGVRGKEIGQYGLETRRAKEYAQFIGDDELAASTGQTASGSWGTGKGRMANFSATLASNRAAGPIQTGTAQMAQGAAGSPVLVSVTAGGPTQPAGPGVVIPIPVRPSNPDPVMGALNTVNATA